MLYRLKELVFGLNEFEKAKIEVRFDIMKGLISNLKLNELRDFELLEEIIYKIKEQLRVKSSNLNKVIADTSRKLTKRDINYILETLDNTKYDFLKKAFAIIKETDEETYSETFEDLEDNIQENISNTPQKVENKTKTVPKIQEENKLQILKTDDVSITVENGKVPYILLNFKKEVNYILLKNFAGLLFETYNPQGTNILIEKNRALIIPRTMGDNLFTMPSNKNINIDEVYNKFKKITKNDNITETKEITEAKQRPTNNEDEGYLDFSPKPDEFKSKQSKKQEDASLDVLLDEVEHKKITPKPDPKQDKSKVKVIENDEDDYIEVKKKKIEIKEPQIEIIKKEENKTKQSTQKQPKSNLDSFIKADKEETKPHENKTNKISKTEKTEKIEKNKQESPQTEIKKEKFEIYRDDKIVAYLNENSKVMGEIIIKPLSEENIKNLNESDLSYAMIFSKVFATILFEVLEAHGTNLIFDYEKNTIRIIPRVQDDKLDLLWTPKHESDQFLDEIRNKLISKMQNEIKDNTNENQGNKDKNGKQPTPKKNTPNKSKIKKKADYILESIRRIP